MPPRSTLPDDDEEDDLTPPPLRTEDYDPIAANPPGIVRAVPDLAARRQKVREMVDAKAREQFQQSRPFAPSSWQRPPSEQTYQQAEREVAVVDQNEAAIAYEEQLQGRAVAVQQRRGQIDQQKARNATVEAQARGTGQKIYKDEYGNWVPEIDPATNKPQFETTPWERGTAPGKPTMQRRSRTGDIETKRPTIRASEDPMDPNVWADLGEGESAPYGTIEEAMADPDISMRRIGAAANQRRKGAVHTQKEAERKNFLMPYEAALSATTLEKDAAEARLAKVTQDVANITRARGGIAPELIAETEGGLLGIGGKPTKRAQQAQAVDAGFEAQLLSLLTEQRQLQADLKPKTGRIKAAHDIAEAQRNQARAQATYDQYVDGASLITERLADGTSPNPEQDRKTLANLQQAIAAWKGGLDAAAQQMQRTQGPPDGAMQPGGTIAPTPGEAAPTSSWLGDMAKRAGRSMVRMPGQVVEGAGMMADALVRGAATTGLMEEGTMNPTADGAGRVREASNQPTPGMATVAATGREMTAEAGKLYEQPGFTPDPARNKELFAQAADSVGSLAGAMVTPGGVLAKTATGALLNSQGQATEARAIMEQRGATPEAADQHALDQFVANLPAGGLEAMPWANLLKRFGGANMANAISTKYGKTMFRRITGSLFGQAALEAGEEMIQQLWGNAAAIAGYDPERKLTEGVGTAGAVGAIMGGGLATPVAVGAELVNRGKKPPAGPSAPPPPAGPTGGAPAAPTPPAAPPAGPAPTPPPAAPETDEDFSRAVAGEKAPIAGTPADDQNRRTLVSMGRQQAEVDLMSNMDVRAALQGEMNKPPAPTTAAPPNETPIQPTPPVGEPEVATIPPSSPLPTEVPPATGTEEVEPVDIGKRDETVSTGTGVPTAKETEMLAEQQRLVDEHKAAQKPPETSVANKEPRQVPLDQITLSTDVPQFKGGANASGVVKPLGGKFDPTGVGPVQLWRRLSGKLELISGRHRFDLAQRTGEKTILAQIHDESAGFDKRAAARLDAELNIRDEQGSIADYANYFKNSDLSEEDAKARGLLARTKGQTGYALARAASEDLFALHQSGRINDAQAEAIINLSGSNHGLQQVGINAALKGLGAEAVADMVALAKQAAADRKAAGDQGDLFGFDDSAMLAMEAQADLARKERRDIQQQIQAVKGAAKNPELAKKMGVDAKKPATILKKVAELETRLELLRKHPEEAGKETAGSPLGDQQVVIGTRADGTEVTLPAKKAEERVNKKQAVLRKLIDCLEGRT